MAEGNPNSSTANSTTATSSDTSHIKVDKLWTEREVIEPSEEQELEDLRRQADCQAVLDKVVVLLLTANGNENGAIRSYLKPLDGKNKILEYQHRLSNSAQNMFAIYYIGKFGACVAAVRNIKQGSSVQGGASTAAILAYDSFKNLGGIIAVGLACGVGTSICDVIVSTKVTRYDQRRHNTTGITSRGTTIDASSYLTELFRGHMKWLPDKKKERLRNAGFRDMPKIVHGEILSGPFLIDDPDVKAQNIKSFAPEAKGIEMEAAYLFDATQGTKTNAIIVKAVCDFGDGTKKDVFQPTAAILAAHCVYSYLSKEGVPDMLRANAPSN